MLNFNKNMEIVKLSSSNRIVIQKEKDLINATKRCTTITGLLRVV